MVFSQIPSYLPAYFGFFFCKMLFVKRKRNYSQFGPTDRTVLMQLKVDEQLCDKVCLLKELLCVGLCCLLGAGGLGDRPHGNTTVQPPVCYWLSCWLLVSMETTYKAADHYRCLQCSNQQVEQIRQEREREERQRGRQADRGIDRSRQTDRQMHWGKEGERRAGAGIMTGKSHNNHMT